MTRRTRSRAAAAKRRETAQPEAPGKEPAGPAKAEPSAVTAIDPEELHRRWAHVRRIISDTVGREEFQDPSIWERGAYRIWLQLVVEQLVVRRDELGIDELAIVSKMLHEQRKLSLDEAKHRQKTGDDEPAAGPTGLPPEFGDIVRQIYGANFQDDTIQPDETAERIEQDAPEGNKSPTTEKGESETMAQTTTPQRNRMNTVGICCRLLLLAAGLSVSCAQTTPAEVDQDSQQHTVTPTSTDQESQQQGSWIGELNITFLNHPGGTGQGDNSLLAGEALASRGADPNGNTWTSNAGHVQGGNQVIMTVTTGGTTTGQEADAEGTGTAHQAPSAAQEQTATQSPETSLAASIPVALWGGMADAAATAAQRGNAESEKTSANTQRWLQTLADKLQDPDFADAINKLMGFGDADEAADAEPTDCGDNTGA